MGISNSELFSFFDTSPVAITVSDSNISDNPIIYANEEFSKITLYDKDSILGNNCRFLQTKKTSSITKSLIKSSINARRSCTVCIENTRSDGSDFQNLLIIEPISFSNDQKFNLGCQFDITKYSESANLESHVSDFAQEMTKARIYTETSWNLVKRSIFAQVQVAFATFHSQKLIHLSRQSRIK